MHEIKEIPDDWAYLPREDLKLAKKAQEMGYTVTSKNPFNPAFGIPHDAVSFQKGCIYIWQPEVRWVVADLIDNRFQNHRKYNNLIEALEAEK